MRRFAKALELILREHRIHLKGRESTCFALRTARETLSQRCSKRSMLSSNSRQSGTHARCDCIVEKSTKDPSSARRRVKRLVR